MKLLVTGINGFVAGHLLSQIKERNLPWQVYGLGRSPYQFPYNLAGYFQGDLENKDFVLSLVGELQPQAIVHLASYSSVGQSWIKPIECFQNNTAIFLNLLEAIRIKATKTRVLSVGSSEEYAPMPPKKEFLEEDDLLDPLSPYAVARVAQEHISRVYCQGFGMDIVMTRSFNHIGPGQDSRFFIPSVIKQLVVAALKGDLSPNLQLGDVSVVRDFIDVRDVAAAYLTLLERGKTGEVYNICSGVGNKLETIIRIASEMLGQQPNITIDPNKVRPNENKNIVGSFKKLHQETGWVPKIPLEQSLGDIIEGLENEKAQ